MTGDTRAIARSGTEGEETTFSTQTWVSATFILIVTTLLSKALGFVRDVLVARYFGASAQVDAFLVAVTLPTLVGGVGFALSTAFIPAYRKALAQGGLSEGRRLAGGSISVTLLISSLFILIIILFANHFVRLLAPGLAPQTLVLAAQLARWLSLLVLGLNLFYMLGAVYNALEHFKIPAFTDLISNVCVLLSLTLLSSAIGIRSLALGMIAGSLLVVILMSVPIVLRRVISLNMNPWNARVRQLVVLAAPVFMIEVLLQAVTVVENFFGAKLGPGNIAALGFAKRLTVMVVSLLAINIARAVFPVFSKLASEKNLAEAKDLFVKLARQYAVAFVPASIALMYFRDDVIRLAFVRGAFGIEAAAKTSAIFLYYSAGLALAAIVPIFIRACYAFSDTLTPLKAAALQLLAMGVLNYFLTPVLGVVGIPLSTSLALIPSLILMGGALAQRFGGLELATLLKAALLAVVCGIAALAPVAELHRWARTSPRGVLQLAFETTVYFIIYFGLGWFVMRQEVRALWRTLRRGS